MEGAAGGSAFTGSAAVLSPTPAVAVTQQQQDSSSGMAGAESYSDLILTQGQATALIMEVVRHGGKVEVERHGLWRDVAAAVGLPYKSDADVERLLTQAATLRGSAGPTWAGEKPSKKEVNTAMLAAPVVAAAATLPPSSLASATVPLSVPVAVVETRSQTGSEASAVAKEGGAAGEANKEITPMDITSTAVAAVSTEATDGGKASKTAKGKEKEKGDGAAAAGETDDNSKEKKRKKRNGKAVEEEPPEDVYTVEKIMGKRKRRGKVEYLIKWEGYPESANTWEKQEDVFCTELIEAFEAELQERAAKRKRKSTNDTKPVTIDVDAQPQKPVASASETQPTVVEEPTQANADKMDVQVADDNNPDGSPKTKRQRKVGPETKQQKTTEEPSVVPVPAPDAEIESKVGFDFGDEIENILGIQRTKDGFLCAYVTWLGKDDCSYVPTQLIAVKSPQKLIAFYESHITFEAKQ